MQSRNRDPYLENKCMDTKREQGWGGMNWESGTDIYSLLCVN